MRKTITNIVLFSVAIILYFIGWAGKYVFILNPLCMTISIGLFLYLWKEEPSLVPAAKKIAVKKTVVPVPGINPVMVGAKIAGVLVCVLLGQFFFSIRYDLFANLAYLCGIIQLALIFPGRAASQPDTPAKLQQKKDDNLKRLISLGGALAGLALLTVSYFAVKKGNAFLSGLLLLAGISLFGYFAAALEKTALPEKKPLSDNTWFNGAIMILLTASAFALRIWDLKSIPPGFSLDEGLVMPVSSGIRNGQPINIFIEDVVFQVASLYYYLVALLWKIVPPSLVTARGMSAVAGTLNVVFIYYMAREMFGSKRVALLSAFFLAFSYFHIIYSRTAWLWIFVPFMAAAAYYFYFKAEKTGRHIYFMLAGAVLGLNLYFYNAAKMVPASFVVYWAFMLVRSAETRALLLKNIKGIAVMVAAAVVVFVPLGLYVIGHYDTYTVRIRTQSFVANMTLPQILTIRIQNEFFKHAAEAFMMFTYKSSGYGYYNLPFKPLLDVVTGFFFTVGFALSAFRWRERKYFMLLAVFILSMSAAVFAGHPSDPNTQRAILSVLPLAIFAALGVEAVFSALRAFGFRYMWIVASAAWLLLSAYVVYDSVDTYFNKYKKDDNVRAEFHYIPSLATGYMNSDKECLYFVSPFFLGSNSFFVDSGVEMKYFDFSILEFDKWPQPAKKSFAFVTEAVYDGGINILKEYFPSVKIERHITDANVGDPKYFYRGFDPVNPKMAFISARVDSADLQALRTLTLRYSLNGTPSEQKINSAQVNVPEGAVNAQVSGLINVPKYGTYSFNGGTVFIDGSRVTAPVTLAAGLHRYKAVIASKPQAPASLEWECDGCGVPKGIIPSQYFVNSDKIFGLKGEYYIDGKKAAEQIDPVITHRGYFLSNRIKGDGWINKHLIIWTGKIRTENSPVLYELESENDSSMEIDGVTVFSRRAGQNTSRPYTGAPGWHRVRIKYDYSGVGVMAAKATVFRLLFKNTQDAAAAEVPYYDLQPY